MSKVYLVHCWDYESNTILDVYDNLEAAELHKSLLEKEKKENTPIPDDIFMFEADDATIGIDEITCMRKFKDHAGYTAEQWEKQIMYSYFNREFGSTVDFGVSEFDLKKECKYDGFKSDF